MRSRTLLAVSLALFFPAFVLAQDRAALDATFAQANHLESSDPAGAKSCPKLALSGFLFWPAQPHGGDPSRPERYKIDREKDDRRTCGQYGNARNQVDHLCGLVVVRLVSGRHRDRIELGRDCDHGDGRKFCDRLRNPD